MQRNLHHPQRKPIQAVPSGYISPVENVASGTMLLVVASALNPPDWAVQMTVHLAQDKAVPPFQQDLVLARALVCAYCQQWRRWNWLCCSP